MVLMQVVLPAPFRPSRTKTRLGWREKLEDVCQPLFLFGLVLAGGESPQVEVLLYGQAFENAPALGGVDQAHADDGVGGRSGDVPAHELDFSGRGANQP